MVPTTDAATIRPAHLLSGAHNPYTIGSLQSVARAPGPGQGPPHRVAPRGRRTIGPVRLRMRRRWSRGTGHQKLSESVSTRWSVGAADLAGRPPSYLYDDLLSHRAWEDQFAPHPSLGARSLHPRGLR